MPTLGDNLELSLSAERKLGEQMARELFRDPDYIDDPVLVAYVQSIWQPLLATARQRGELTAELDERFAWQVLLGKDRVINAFALPGGWMGVNLGLIGVTTSGDELASVLAHELSHVTQRHIARLVGQQNRQGPWLMAAMLLGALALSKNPDAGNAVMAGSQALAAREQLSFSRDMEREADRLGYAVATQAGFEPRAFVTMFDKLQQAARLNDSGNFPYLRSHPMTTERIADMQARQLVLGTGPGAVPASPASSAPTGPLEHALMAARARVMSADNPEALRQAVLQAQVPNLERQPLNRQAAALYAGAWASARLREASTADLLQQQLAARVAHDTAASRQVRWLAAELALRNQDAARAWSLTADRPLGSARPQLLLAAQAGLLSGHTAQVASALQTWVTTYPRDAAVWQLLGRAYSALGQTQRAIRSEAEAQAAQLDYAAAVDRLKAAQDWARQHPAEVDNIEASIVDTRTRQLEQLLREQALER